jgi:hypothetical protein
VDPDEEGPPPVGTHESGGPYPPGTPGLPEVGPAGAISIAVSGVGASGTSSGIAAGKAIASAGGNSIASAGTAAAGASTGPIGTSEIRLPQRARSIIVPSVTTRSPFAIRTAFRVQKILSPRR